MKFESVPNPDKKIGVGGYKRAYLAESPRPEVHLVFKHQYTNEQIKGLFYLNKIATALFPGKIATVTQAGNVETNGAVSTQAFTKYVEPDEGHKALQNEALKFDYDYTVDNPSREEHAASRRFEKMQGARQKVLKNSAVQEFEDAYEKSGLVAGFGEILGWGSQDVIMNDDGSFTFVDVDVAWDEPEDLGENEYTKECLRFDPQKLQESISKLEEPVRTEAQTSFDRLIVLCKEVGFKL